MDPAEPRPRHSILERLQRRSAESSRLLKDSDALMAQSVKHVVGARRLIGEARARLQRATKARA